MPDYDPDAIDPAAIRDRIGLGLGELFPEPRPQATEALTRLVVLLAQWAPRMNLTGHRDPLDMTSHLVLDAAALVAALPELANAPDLADLGSGAGFPGLPIAILCPNLRVHLIESRQKRHHFQREVRRQLALENALPLLGRSDEVELRPCAVVIAQAMTRPEQALAQMLPWMRAGGIMVLPATAEAEPPDLPESSRLERRRYRVPLTHLDRQLWVVRSGPR